MRKELTVIAKNNDKLPEGWSWFSLGKVANVIAGNPAPQGKQFFENGTYPFVRVQDMGRLGSQRRLSQTNDYINDKAVKKLKLIPKGAVLFTKSGASTLLNQRAILGSDMYVVSHIAAAIPHDGIKSEWLYYWLKTVDFNYIAHATTLPSLPLSKAREIPVPVAPPNEQKRIVAEIEKQFSRLDEAVANLKRVKANLKQYKASVLKAAVEGKLTEEWRKKNLPAPSSKPGKFYTYAILCDNDSIYIGHTDDIERRWKQHLKGKGTEWTTKYKPVKIVHWEEFDTRKEAAEREKWLKTGYGRKWIKREYAAGRTRQAGHVEPADKLLQRILAERRKRWEEAELAKMKANWKKPKDDKWKKKYKEPAKLNLNDLPELQDGWLWVNIDQIMLLLTDYHANGSYKVLKKHVTILDEDAYAIYVRATNLKKNKFDSDLKFVNKKAYDFLTKSKIFGNEIIIGKIGNAGKVYYMPKLDQPCTLGMNLFMLRFNQFLSGKYIYYHLVSFFSEKEIKSKVKGVGNPSIDKNAIRSLRIALPPIKEQDQIVKVVDEQMSLIAHFENELEHHLFRADRLRQSILKKAFSGQLVNQNNNKLAAELLGTVNPEG